MVDDKEGRREATDAADPTPERLSVLGVRVDRLRWPEIMSAIAARRERSLRTMIVTPNPEMIMLARRDERYRAALAGADLAPADGVGVRVAGRILGQPVGDVIPGSELTVRLAEAGAKRGERWFLLGGQEGIARAAGEALTREYPGLVIAGALAGSPDPADDDEMRGHLSAAAPLDMLLVAFGAPRQELWLARNAPYLEAAVAVGVGGTFNFLAGRSPWPPTWARRAGLIWLWRLATEPWRWRRQLALIEFVVAVARQRIGILPPPENARGTGGPIADRSAAIDPDRSPR